MLFEKPNSVLCGIRMYNSNDKVVFTTNDAIEKEGFRTAGNYKLT